MKKYIKILLIIITIFFTIIQLSGCTRKTEKNEKIQIVTSFYPVYIMTSNITKGANNVELNIMADSNIGCIHNYTLKPADLKKIENADFFVENGLEIESFNDKLINSFKNLKIIDSSRLINGLADEDELNGHTWTSINNYIVQLNTIKDDLCSLNPENSEIYKKNTNKYEEELLKLKEKYDVELQGLKGKKATVLSEAFAYLLNDLKMQTIEIHTEHEESTISAEKIKSIIKEMKEKNINIIIIDKNDDEKNAETISKETGAKTYKLNSCMSGNLEIDSYLNDMNENLEILKQML